MPGVTEMQLTLGLTPQRISHLVGWQKACPFPKRRSFVSTGGIAIVYINHIFWVRDLVVSTRLGEKAAAGEADKYGEKNAKAIGQSIAPFYGQVARKNSKPRSRSR